MIAGNIRDGSSLAIRTILLIGWLRAYLMSALDVDLPNRYSEVHEKDTNYMVWTTELSFFLFRRFRNLAYGRALQVT